MSVRPGRFKFTTATGNVSQELLYGNEDAYRIFNSGKVPFSVRGKASGTTITVDPRCSLDVNVKGLLRVGATPNNDIEGIYDVLQSTRGIRTGRFNLNPSSTVPTPTVPATIVDGEDGEIFRIYNSGKLPLEIATGSSGSGTQTIGLRQSMDLICGDSITVGPEGAEGIYVNLQRDSDVRSGRFSLEKGAGKQTVLNLNDANHTALYRIFNSGDHAIRIWVTNPNPLQQDYDFALNREQSVDVRFKQNDNIELQADDPANAVEGIIDFLA